MGLPYFARVCAVVAAMCLSSGIAAPSLATDTAASHSACSSVHRRASAVVLSSMAGPCTASMPDSSVSRK